MMLETDTHDQTSVLLIHGKECPSEGTARGILSSGPYQELIGSHRMNDEICDAAHIYPVANRQVLQFRSYLSGASNSPFAAEVLNQVIAIEAGPVVPDLDNPGPDVFRASRDCDRPSGAECRSRDKIVPWQRPG